MSVCEGTTEEACWETSINIPIVDCHMNRHLHEK